VKFLNDHEVALSEPPPLFLMNKILVGGGGASRCDDVDNRDDDWRADPSTP